jgi:TP901 family phage tail tape measure protein
MANKALNEFAINVAVYDAQLIKLGRDLDALGVKAANLNKKLGVKPTTGGGRSQVVKTDNKDIDSSKRRKENITKDQLAERRSRAKTDETLRMQSARFQKYNTKIQASSRLTKNEITDMFRRVALWSTGIGVLFGTLSKIKFIFGAVKDLEVQMAELKKVMNDDTPFKTAQRALFQTALSMSVSVDKAAEIAKTWAQQGYELKEVATLTRTALLGVNAANLTAAQSVEFLTSAMKSFKLEAEETAGAIDAIMAIQADFAITSANLAKGMQVAGAITAQLGGDMSELFGMMTAIGEVTRETGNVIGNSLKTQLARIQQPRTIAYLERLGVATRRITDEGAVRRLSAYDIFKQISKQRIEGTLTKEQVLDISLKIGGIRKFKDALILIENFDTAMAAMHTGFLAYGEAESASGIIQETLARQMDKLNTAFVDLGDTIANLGEMSGLDTLKYIVSSFTSLIQTLSSVAKGESWLGGVGSAALQALPFAIIGGFVKFLGKRVFQNIRGTELRSVQEMANIGQTPIGRTVAQSRYTFFGKQAIDPKFAKAWGQEMRNINAEAKKAGISMTPAHKQMAFMSTRAKMMDSDIGNLGKTAGKFRTRWNLMGRALRSTLLPGTISGAAPRGMQASGMLATARIMSSIGSLAKGLVGMGAFLLAIEGLIKGSEYIKSLQPKLIEFEGIVDPASQASEAFALLSGSLVQVKKDAKDAKVSLDEYLKDRSFSDKALDLQPIAEQAGKVLFASLFEGLEKEIPKFNAQAFREFAKARDIAAISLPDSDKDLEKLYNNITKTLKSGAVNNRAIFKKFLLGVGIDEKDLPTEEITKKFQKIFRDFLKFEIAGDLAKAAKESNQNLGELIDRLKDGFKDAKVDLEGFSKAGIGSIIASAIQESLKSVGITGGKDLIKELSLDIAGASESEILFANLMSGFVGNFKTIAEAFEDADQTIGGKSFQEIFGIKDQESIASAINKVFNKWEEIGKKSDALPEIHEIIGEYLDRQLGTFSPGADLTPSIKAGGGLTPEQEALQNIRDAARAHIDASLKAIANQGLALVQAFTGLERPLSNSLNLFSEAALGAAFALLKIPDLIFNKLSDFVADIEKINIRSSLSNILGTGKSNPAQAILDAGRKWITTSVETFPIIESGVRKAANVQEKVRQAFKDDTYGFGAVLKLVDQDVISQNTAFGKIKDIVAKNKNAQDTGIKKSASETQKIITDVMKVRETERLLKTEIDTAVKSWTNLTGIVKDAFGVDIGGEVDIKKMFFEVFETGDTKLLEQALGGLVNGWIDDAAKVIKDVGLEKLSTEMQQKTNKLLSYGKRLYKTGVDVADAQINSIIDTQIKLNELDISSGILRKQLAGTAADDSKKREDIIATLALNEAEKQATIQMQSLTLSMELMAIEANKIKEATDTARVAFTQLFADVKQFDPTTNAPALAFEDTFNQIANTRLEFISERFTNQILAGFEKYAGEEFGEFLLGEELKDPLILNTDALSENTMSINELRFAIAQMLGLGAVGGFEDVMGGESFSEKTRQIEAGLEQLSEIFDEGGKKIEFNIKDILSGAGQILGGIFGGKAAAGRGKETNLVNVGTAFGGAAGKKWLGFLDDFAGPFGSILGGIIGGLFGRDKEIQEEQNENLHRISDNTAELVALDRRIINAPASFTLPAGAQGGSLQWSGNIIVQGGNTNEDTARVVLDVINNQFRGTTNYNTVAGA